MKISHQPYMTNNKVNFKSCTVEKDRTGREYRVFYRPEKDLTLEIMRKNRDGNYEPVNNDNIGIKKTGSFSYIPNNIISTGNYLYRWVKKDGTQAPSDNGVEREINGNKYVEISEHSKYFSAYRNNAVLVMIDSCTDKTSNLPKNSHISSGGNFETLIKKLDEIQKDGYDTIFLTPFTRDESSSHKYSSENIYQQSPDFGTLEQLGEFFTKASQKGIRVIMDAAFINEGPQGMHFQDVLLNGKDSPFYDWFGVTDMPITLNVFDKNNPHKENIRFKIINSPYNIELQNGKIVYTENEKYNPNKETWVQIYDDLLTPEEYKTNEEFITGNTYTDKKVKNSYNLIDQYSAVFPFRFRITQKDLLGNIKGLNLKKSDMSSKYSEDVMTGLLSTSTVKIGRNLENIATWDGKKETILLNHDNLEVVDYSRKATIYWVNFVKNNQLDYFSKIFEGADTVEKVQKKLDIIKKEGNLQPNIKALIDEIDKTTIQNVLDNKYNLSVQASRYQNCSSDELKSDVYLYESLRGVSLEALGFSNEISAIFSSGYMTPRPRTSRNDNDGIDRNTDFNKTAYERKANDYATIPSKYREVYKKFDEAYDKQIVPYIREIFKNIDATQQDSQKLIDNNGNMTERGSYFTDLLAFDFMKALMVKAIAGDDAVQIKDGKITYDEAKIKQVNLASFGTDYNTRVTIINNKLKEVVSNEQLKKDLQAYITQRIGNISVQNVNMARLLVQQEGISLGLRLDAFKDIANTDKLRNGEINFDTYIDNVINIWGKILEDVKKITPGAYGVAEITDIATLKSIFGLNSQIDANEAERLMVEKTGMTSTADYNYMNPTLKFFAKNVEEYVEHSLPKVLSKGWGNGGMLHDSSRDSVANRYQFAENHDKPRILHILGLDMEILHRTNKDNEDKQIKAAQYIFDNDNITNCNSYNNMALAMGYRAKKIFEELYNTGKGYDNITFEEFDKAIKVLTKNQYTDENGNIQKLEKDIFGSRPFDITGRDILEEINAQRKKEGKSPISEDKITQIAEDFCIKMLTTNIGLPEDQKIPIENLLKIKKLFSLLPGIPTDFMGVFLGASGYESVCCNIYLQNRNNPTNLKSGLKNFNTAMKEINKLRTEPKLSALCQGETQHLSSEYNDSENKHYTSFFRYDTHGSQVICLTSSDINFSLDELSLGDVNLEVGLKFKNFYNDNEIYEVVQRDSGLCLKKQGKEEGNYDKITITGENAHSSLVLYRTSDDNFYQQEIQNKIEIEQKEVKEPEDENIDCLIKKLREIASRGLRVAKTNNSNSSVKLKLNRIV